jgi:hypothetical protein
MNDRHMRVLGEVFSHPLPRNLEWREVVSVVNELGSALQRHDGKYEFQIGRTKAVFTKPHDKDMEPEGITELRRFLLQAWSDAGPAAPKATVVVIDHRGARIFAAGADGELAERAHIEPHDPHGFRRHLEHRKEADYSGQRVPEADEFYERVAEQLRSDSAIAVLGDATGKSSAMRFLLEYLEEHHKDIARRIVATARDDGSRNPQPTH